MTFSTSTSELSSSTQKVTKGAKAKKLFKVSQVFSHSVILTAGGRTCGTKTVQNSSRKCFQREKKNQ